MDYVAIKKNHKSHFLQACCDCQTNRLSIAYLISSRLFWKFIFSSSLPLNVLIVLALSINSLAISETNLPWESNLNTSNSLSDKFPIERSSSWCSKASAKMPAIHLHWCIFYPTKPCLPLLQVQARPQFWSNNRWRPLSWPWLQNKF